MISRKNPCLDRLRAVTLFLAAFSVLGLVACDAGMDKHIASDKATKPSTAPSTKPPTAPVTTNIDIDIDIADQNATTETKALLWNLKKVGQESLLFGHQDDLAYGVHWINEPGRSDVKDVTGSYPAIIGWELGDLETGAEVSIDKVNFEDIKGWIKEHHQRGGISTISWHMDDPVSGESSWYKASVVEHLIPGGSAHEKFQSYLDKFVEFNNDLKVTDENGAEVYVPIIFRPWHEHSGDWFWWGRGNTSEEDYIALWRFTVEYLRDEKKVHNLIYAYSPDRSRIDLDNFENDYLWGYPGDEYIDIIGLDNYMDLGISENVPREKQIESLTRSLQYTVEIAEKKNKIAALTEGGQDGLADSTFWTEKLLASIQANDATQKIAYVVVWRNANKETEKRDHFYAPYPGQPSEEDFIRFYKHPRVLFLDELPDMYSTGRLD